MAVLPLTSRVAPGKADAVSERLFPHLQDCFLICKDGVVTPVVNGVVKRPNLQHQSSRPGPVRHVPSARPPPQVSAV